MLNDGHDADEAALTYELDADESPSDGVIAAVAAISGSEPVPTASTNGDPDRVLEPLYAAVDPEALDSLFDRPTADAGRVTFPYHGYEVTVHGEDRVRVARLESAMRAGGD
jgi:hypothetical protein